MYDLTMTSYYKHAPKIEKLSFYVCKILATIDFYVKNHKRMQFSWDFSLNMLENVDSNLQTSLKYQSLQIF